MIALNLTAKNSREQTVLENLIPMVSETLAEKINNGVYIEKDGKRLLNKKDLSTFMDYAAEQAKNTLSENQRTGKQAVCVHGDDIMSWAIHYFEEESIEGKLYNEDGTEYQPPKPVAKPYTPTTPQKPKDTVRQGSLFDDILGGTSETATETKPVTEAKPERKPDAVYERYLSAQKRYLECVVAYRLGDFYEIFGDDAVKISDDLDMTLTSRDFGLESRVPMIGIPFHAAESYFVKIVKHGHKLAVVEPLDGKNFSERVIAPKPQEQDEPDEDVDDDLTEEEMRKFDGDLDETAVPAEQADDNDDFDLAAEKERLKAIDTAALCILGELFDGEIEIQ